MKNELCFLPAPARLEWTGGLCRPALQSLLHPALPEALAGLHNPLAVCFFGGEADTPGDAPGARGVPSTSHTASAPAGPPAWAGEAPLRFAEAAGLPKEGYRLRVTPEAVTVEYADAAGAYYALVTLGQALVQCSDALACFSAEDAPGLAVRGVMLDVSRGKIPKMAELYRLIDLLAQLKINLLVLYFEGFSFAYPSFPEVWQGGGPLTPDECEALWAYCRARCIDLIPCQNSLGHMARWLALPRFAPLAEVEGGFDFMGMHIPPTTLNPADPRSLALVEQLIDDLSPHFPSSRFHAGLDEPFELGRGKSKAAAEQRGLGAVYTDYLQKLATVLERKNKQTLVWGDVLARHPETLAALPKGVQVLEWGYEAEHPFAARAAALQAAGVSWLACPGTSSWASFSGITDNMLGNVAAAAKAAYAHGAEGLLTTDWGDGGHAQYIPASYAGFGMGAAFGWNPAGVSEETLALWLSRVVYRDEAGVMGRFSLALGRTNRFEEFVAPCKTLAGEYLAGGLLDEEAWQQRMAGLIAILGVFVPPCVEQAYAERYENRGPLRFEEMAAELDALGAALARQKMRCADAAQTAAEAQNTLALLRLLGEARFRRVYRPLPDDAQKKTMAALAEQMCAIAQTHEALWLARNRPAGLETSLEALTRFEAQLLKGSRLVVSH